MKRFRFRLQALLDLKRRRLEELEAHIARIESRRASSNARAARAKQEAAELRAEVVQGERIDVRELRAVAAWATHLDDDAQAAVEAARRLGYEAQDALARRISLQREVDALEKLRDRALAEHRRAQDLEEEAVATELFLARRHAKR